MPFGYDFKMNPIFNNQHQHKYATSRASKVSMSATTEKDQSTEFKIEENVDFKKLDPNATPIVPRDFKEVKKVGSFHQPLKKDFNASYPLNVLSYNILADCYTTDVYKERMYQEKDRAVLQDFNYRSTRILKEIEQSEADILCL